MLPIIFRGILTCLDLQKVGNELLKVNMLADAVFWLEAAIQKCLKRTKTEEKFDSEIQKFYIWQLYVDLSIALLKKGC